MVHFPCLQTCLPLPAIITSLSGARLRFANCFLTCPSPVRSLMLYCITFSTHVSEMPKFIIFISASLPTQNISVSLYVYGEQVLGFRRKLEQNKKIKKIHSHNKLIVLLVLVFYYNELVPLLAKKARSTNTQKRDGIFDVLLLLLAKLLKGWVSKLRNNWTHDGCAFGRRYLITKYN